MNINRKTELLRAIAHPMRVKILDELGSGVKCVGDIEKFLGMSQPNVSQHLALLRRLGLIDYYMDGRLRCYYLRSSIVPEILGILGKNFSRELPPPVCCPAHKKRAIRKLAGIYT